jgi:DNA-binding beta-propeller fold protein YncE
MTRTRLFLAALSSIGSLCAQPSGLFGPVQGYTFDAPTRSIRAVIGSLGSASLGPAVLAQIDFAAVAPRQNYAIVFRGGRAALVSSLSSGEPSTTLLPEFSSPPQGAIWSDDGSVAVLYSRTASWIQIFTDLPASINPGTTLDISSLGGALSAVAVDSHGQHVAIGVTGDNAGVYQITDGQTISPLLAVSRPIGLAFSVDGGALFALDGATNQASEINLITSATQTWPLDVDDAVAIRPARDSSNRTVLYVAGRKSRLLVAYDDSTRQRIASVDLSFDPVVIEPIGNNGFLLSRRSANNDPLWSFANGAQPMVYFVPATPIPADRHREVRPR